MKIDKNQLAFMMKASRDETVLHVQVTECSLTFDDPKEFDICLTLLGGEMNGADFLGEFTLIDED